MSQSRKRSINLSISLSGLCSSRVLARSGGVNTRSNEIVHAIFLTNPSPSSGPVAWAAGRFKKIHRVEQLHRLKKVEIFCHWQNLQ